MSAKQTSNKKKPGHTRRLANRDRFSKSVLALFVVVFAAVGGYLLWKSFAAPSPPTVYLSPASNVNGASTSFTVQIRENSGTTAVNAIQANLSFPTTQLTLVSIDYTGSAFGTAAQSTIGTGTASIGRGVSCTTTCPTLTGDQLVATLNFKTTTTGGTATVSFTSGTVLVSASTNQDILGGLAQTAGGSYVVDTTPPTVSITAPANNATLAGGSTVNITTNPSDTQSSITKVEFYIDGTLTGTVTSSPFTYAWNTTGVTLASHTIMVKAYDSSGNVGSSSTITVTLADQTPPTAVTNFRTTGLTLNSIALAWNASTDNVGVTNYKLSRNGTLIATLSSTTLTYSDTGLSPSTTYNYSITAGDAAGNNSTATILSATTNAQTPGDINGDGHVDSSDLTILLANYGTTYAPADLNHNGTVDIFDLSILLSHFGS